MKRYFVVKNESLIKLLKEYGSMRNRIDDTFKKFAQDNGIETKTYYQHTDRLKIVPTEKDLRVFGDVLKVDRETFKKNSAISKEWVKLCEIKGLRTPKKPVWELRDLIDDCIYRFRSSLFSLNDEVYGTFEADEDFSLPGEHFIELKASEFYKTIEEQEEGDI